jgi:tRNA nucleotidyltransferase (CCA-adding enzyme)
MAKPGAVYPQVDVSAAALMERRLVRCPLGLSVRAARDRVRHANAEAVWFADGGVVRRAELERACDWGLGRLRASAIAWPATASVSARATEIEIRRRLLEGASVIVVRDGHRVVGVIDVDRVELARPSLSVVHRIERRGTRSGEAMSWLLRVAGKVGEGRGAPVFAVGGFVRDLLLDRPSPDVDLMVEGDGIVIARSLVDEVSGRLVVHPEFGTARIEEATGPEGAPLDRIDIASARRERYDAPGALPIVSTATATEDLGRRDFSVNAMAVVLCPSSFGRLLDPFGGHLDLKRRRLRPLSPLSFVEDPTRAFRAARYAARLSFTMDPLGARALRLAVSVGHFPALSGQRLHAELSLLAKEATGWRGLELALGWGLFTLWDRGYRGGSAGRRALRAAGRLCGWARENAIDLDRAEVALTAVLMNQRAVAVDRCLSRLAVHGERRARVRAAVTARPLVRPLDEAKLAASEVAELLRARPTTVLAGMWLHGSARARRRIEWFLSRGRTIRPRLSGDEIVALGVRRGPAVGQCLAALRRLRLDGALATADQEREFVKQWQRAPVAARVETQPSGGGLDRAGMSGRQKRRSV